MGIYTEPVTGMGIYVEENDMIKIINSEYEGHTLFYNIVEPGM